jgi:hypothetical protein
MQQVIADSAEDVMAAPASQVLVERIFSLLGMLNANLV